MKICFQYSRDQQMKNLHKNLIKTSPWSGYLFKQQPMQNVLAERSDSRDIGKLARRLLLHPRFALHLNKFYAPHRKKSVEYCVCIFYTVFWTINRHTRSITVEIIHWLILCDEQVAFALSVNLLRTKFRPHAHDTRWVALQLKFLFSAAFKTKTLCTHLSLNCFVLNGSRVSPRNI